ncbi:hypothetical protein KI387_032552, partial [Taxus chinensis]
IIIATLTVLERVLDTFVSWLPMYGEAKVAFILYLWYPKTKGTSYVYDAFVRPFVAKHEVDIDRSIHELKTRAGDMVLLYGRKSSYYVQARIFDALQYVATQSSRARPVQNVQQFRPDIPATGSRQAGQAAGSRHTGSAVAPRQPQPSAINRQPTPAVSSQPTQGAISEPPQQPVQPPPAESVVSVSSSTSESTEEVEVDMVEVQKKQVATREQSMEQTLCTTRSMLRQTRSQTNVKAD